VEIGKVIAQQVGFKTLTAMLLELHNVGEGCSYYETQEITGKAVPVPKPEIHRC
jgi:hypothetical protein